MTATRRNAQQKSNPNYTAPTNASNRKARGKSGAVSTSTGTATSGIGTSSASGGSLITNLVTSMNGPPALRTRAASAAASGSLQPADILAHVLASAHASAATVTQNQSIFQSATDLVALGADDRAAAERAEAGAREAEEGAAKKTREGGRILLAVQANLLLQQRNALKTDQKTESALLAMKLLARACYRQKQEMNATMAEGLEKMKEMLKKGEELCVQFASETDRQKERDRLARGSHPATRILPDHDRSPLVTSSVSRRRPLRSPSLFNDDGDLHPNVIAEAEPEDPRSPDQVERVRALTSGNDATSQMSISNLTLEAVQVDDEEVEREEPAEERVEDGVVMEGGQDEMVEETREERYVRESAAALCQKLEVIETELCRLVEGTTDYDAIRGTAREKLRNHHSILTGLDEPPPRFCGMQYADLLVISSGTLEEADILNLLKDLPKGVTKLKFLQETDGVHVACRMETRGLANVWVTKGGVFGLKFKYPQIVPCLAFREVNQDTLTLTFTTGFTLEAVSAAIACIGGQEPTPLDEASLQYVVVFAGVAEARRFVRVFGNLAFGADVVTVSL